MLFGVLALLLALQFTENLTTDLMPSIHVWERIRIGTRSANSVDLTLIGRAVIGPDSSLFVTQPRERVVRVFSPTGSLINEFGGEGEGPGEFGGVTDVGWKGDTLWVFDAQLARVSFFSPSGAFLDSFGFRAPPYSDMTTTTIPGAVLSDGSVLTLAGSTSLMIAQGVATSTPILRVDRQGRVLGPVAWTDPSKDRVQIRASGNRIRRRRMLQFRNPFSDSRLFAVSPDGASIILLDRSLPSAGSRGTVEISALDATGRTIWKKTLRVKLLDLNPSEVQRVVEDMVRVAMDPTRRLFPSLRDARQTISASLSPPAAHPTVTDLALGRDHTIWLRREALGGDLVAWTKLSKEGDPIGNVVLPRTAKVLTADGSALWVADTDSLGVAQIARFDLSPVRPRLPGGANDRTSESEQPWECLGDTKWQGDGHFL
jgi:hypothetical protein